MPLGDLGPRELEVAVLVAEGMSNQQIAERLVKTEGTVRTQVSAIASKLDLPEGTWTRVDLAFAIKQLIPRGNFTIPYPNPVAVVSWPLLNKRR